MEMLERKEDWFYDFEYYLNCKYDSGASFYKKAKVLVHEDEFVEHNELLSYDTLVANYVYYKKENKKVYEYFGYYSGTTTRHQKEFFRQLGLTESEIKELWLKERLEIKEDE